MYEARNFKKDNRYKFVWINDGKDESTRTVFIQNSEVLKK